MSFLNNLSFLITFVLFLVMIGLIWYHFNDRLNEQNGKISQMVRVLTTMTTEVSLIRKKVGLPFPDTIDINNNQPPVDNKIDVSDDEEESDDSDSDSDSDDSDSDSDSDTDSDEEEPKKEEPKKEEPKIEINDIDDEIKEEIVENIVEEIINHLEEDIDLGIDVVDDIEEEKEEDNEEKEEKEEVKEDYKKMSLNKLKSIVLEKKLTTDVKTLKKNDLLSILGVEV
jgi:hypothetical protein